MQWQINGNIIEVSIGENEEAGIFEPFSMAFYVSAVWVDYISGNETLEITIHTHKTGVRRLVVSSDEVAPGIIRKLNTKGLRKLADKTNDEIVQAILIESQDFAQCFFRHEVLGFTKRSDGKEVFLHHRPCGDTDPLKSQSTYIFEDMLKPHGCLTGWKNAVKNHVCGRGNMELALAIGAIAPIAHILRERKVISEVPLVALIGASTSGKTTSLMVASSIWGSRDMIMDFNCTQNAMMTQLSQTRGLPMLVDESSAVPDWDLTSFIYNLPTGKAKLRSKGDGTLQKRQTFSGAIVFTGETSFFDQTRKTKGLHARLLELTLPWTESAEHAEAIAREFGCHYAVAAQPLMDWILKNKHLLKSMYQEYYEGFIELSKDFLTDPALKRLLKICALIATAADVLNQALGLNLDVDKIAITLIEVMQEKSEALRNNPLIWYQKLLNRVMNNKSKFPKRDEISKSSTLWGISDYHKSNNIVWIREDKFEEFISQITTVELKLVKQLLADGRYILRDDSRHYTFKKNVHGVEQMYYGVFTTHPPKNPDRIVPRRTKLLK